MIINKPYMHTKIQIWSPKYSSMHGIQEEPVVLISKSKVDHATSPFIVEFTKAKHLMGQRFAIYRGKAQACPLSSNGKISCYEVPLSLLESWQTELEQISDDVKFA